MLVELESEVTFKFSNIAHFRHKIKLQFGLSIL